MTQDVSTLYTEYARFPTLNLNDFAVKSAFESYSVWNFCVTLEYCGEKRSKLVFTDENDSNIHRFWKVQGRMEFRAEVNKLPTLVEEFYCDPDHPAHIFDCSRLIAEDCDFSIKMYFKRLDGFDTKPRPWNYFSPSSETDVYIIAGGKKIYQNKQILAYHSQYFKGLFFGNFSEKCKDEVEICNVSSGDLISLFDAMHGSHLINNATKYAMQYLMLDETLETYHKLFLSDKYRLSILQAKILSEWTHDDVIAVTKGTDEYIRQLSMQTLNAVVKFGWKKHIEETEQE